jgi:hypothetical protein
VLLGLIVVLVMGGLAVAGCGGGGGSDEQAKAAVQGSLAKIDATVQDMTAKGVSGALTVAEIKAARDAMKPEISTIVENGKNIEGVDVGKVESAWSDLDKAVTELPDSATLAEAGAVLLTKVQPLTAALGEVKAVVTPTS